jgi:hypothetical protein
MKRRKFSCPHCDEQLPDGFIVSWSQHCQSLKRKRPPDQKADCAPPVQTEDAPKPETITQERLKASAGPHTPASPMLSRGHVYSGRGGLRPEVRQSRPFPGTLP